MNTEATTPEDAELIRLRALHALEEMLGNGVFDGPKLRSILRGQR